MAEIEEVELTEQEGAALFTEPTEKPSEKKESLKEEATEPKESEEESKEGPSEEQKITIDGTEYSFEQLQKALDDSKNKKDWQKSNTEKAMELSANRKLIQDLIDLRTTLNDNSGLMELLEQSLSETIGDEKAGKFIESLKNFDADKVPNPYAEELKAEKEKREAIEAQIAMDAEVKTLRKNFKLTERQAEEVFDFAVKKMAETEQYISLEDAYKLMNFDKLKEEAEKKKMEDKRTPVPSGKGAKGIQSKILPEERVEDIDISEYKDSLFV